MCIYYILELIKSFLPVLLGLFLAYIAWQQMKTNRNKLKLDLFNKRIEIYTDAISFIQNVALESSIEEESLKEIQKKFINSRDASSFLFSKSPEIYELLDKIHTETFKITGFMDMRNQAGIPPELLSKSAKEVTQVRVWLIKQPKILRALMNKYLSL